MNWPLIDLVRIQQVNQQGKNNAPPLNVVPDCEAISSSLQKFALSIVLDLILDLQAERNLLGPITPEQTREAQELLYIVDYRAEWKKQGRPTAEEIMDAKNMLFIIDQIAPERWKSGPILELIYSARDILFTIDQRPGRTSGDTQSRVQPRQHMIPLLHTKFSTRLACSIVLIWSRTRSAAM